MYENTYLRDFCAWAFSIPFFFFYSPPLLPFWITAESAGKRPYVRNVLNIIYYFWLDTKTTIDRNRRGEIPLDEYILENNDGSVCNAEIRTNLLAFTTKVAF